MEIEYEVKKAIEGNKESFTFLIKHYEQSLYKVAKSILKSDADCADAIQETILKAYKSIDKLKERKYFKTWLIRILINECYNIKRQKGKLIPIQEIEKTAYEEPMFTTIDNHLEMQELLSYLDDDLKSVVVLYYFEEFSIKEVANLSDRSNARFIN